MSSDTTTCKKCGRAVMVAHVNAAGNCILCDPSTVQPSGRVVAKDSTVKGRMENAQEDQNARVANVSNVPTVPDTEQ